MNKMHVEIKIWNKYVSDPNKHQTDEEHIWNSKSNFGAKYFHNPNKDQTKWKAYMKMKDVNGKWT